MAENEIRWERFPVASATPRAKTWLQIQQHLGLARNTIQVYARAIEGYLAFAAGHQIDVERAGREQIARSVRDLLARPSPRGPRDQAGASGVGLANATLHQRLTAVRLFYDYLVEEGVHERNPVGSGRYMIEQSDCMARSSGAGGRAPRADGWRARAEQAHGGLAPDQSLTLTASEIGAYTFCPQAWYLQRCHVPVTAMAEERRRSGSGMHRQIGRQTDLVRAAGALRTILLLAIGVLLVLLVALVLRGFG